MFGKLKNKLKEWASKVSEIKENPTEVIEEFEDKIIEKSEITTKEENKGFLKKLFGKKVPDNYFIYKAEGRSKKEIDENLASLEKIYGKGFAYNQIFKSKESREQIIQKFKEKIKEFSIKNPKMKFIIDYSYGFGRMMKLELEECEKYNFEIIEINKKNKDSIIDKKPSATKITIDSDKLKDNKVEEETLQISKHKSKNIDSKVPKQGFLKKLLSSKKIITEEQFMNYSEDLEMILLENNVALVVSDKIIEELKNNIVGIELSKKEIEKKISSALKEIIESILLEPFDIIEEIKNKDGPYVMIFCGINGVGKTTTIAKFVNMLKEKGLTSVMAAADTFRAAAIEQLKIHGDKLNVKVISHKYGSDPAAVGFDAIKYAKKNKIDVVLIDTAGRMHTAINLLQEMVKIKRVCKPDRTIFLGESITGNDAVDQIKAFNDTIGIDGIILSKADIDEKGGTALSVGYITQKPILFLGTGQNYKDLEPFDKKKFIEKLGL